MFRTFLVKHFDNHKDNFKKEKPPENQENGFIEAYTMVVQFCDLCPVVQNSKFVDVLASRLHLHYYRNLSAKVRAFTAITTDLHQIAPVNRLTVHPTHPDSNILPNNTYNPFFSFPHPAALIQTTSFASDVSILGAETLR
jgi:hypothetical protein